MYNVQFQFTDSKSWTTKSIHKASISLILSLLQYIIGTYLQTVPCCPFTNCNLGHSPILSVKFTLQIHIPFTQKVWGVSPHFQNQFWVEAHSDEISTFTSSHPDLRFVVSLYSLWSVCVCAWINLLHPVSTTTKHYLNYTQHAASASFPHQL